MIGIRGGSDTPPASPAAGCTQHRRPGFAQYARVGEHIQCNAASETQSTSAAQLARAARQSHHRLFCHRLDARRDVSVFLIELCLRLPPWTKQILKAGLIDLMSR